MTLLGLLRSETKAEHRTVEDVSDLPRSVRSVLDYVDVLHAFVLVHGWFESQLTQLRFADGWSEHGIDLDRHRRLDHLVDDLAELGTGPAAASTVGPRLTSFGEALGCLYVLEGSALGGRQLSPELTRRFPGLPVRYLGGAGRDHPAPWRSVQHALGRFDTSDRMSVLSGASATFTFFATHLSVAARSTSTQ